VTWDQVLKVGGSLKAIASTGLAILNNIFWSEIVRRLKRTVMPGALRV
jgi:hypothetical protein